MSKLCIIVNINSERNDKRMANVSKEELLHIANLAELNIKDEEIENYLINLQDILSFAEIVNNANTEGLEETIGENDKFNVFRKDEVELFEDNKSLLENAPSKEQNMFKIPKVINQKKVIMEEIRIKDSVGEGYVQKKTILNKYIEELKKYRQKEKKRWKKMKKRDKKEA